MIFNEIYGAYYNSVAAILKVAVDHNISMSEINDIVSKYAFGESVLNIPESLKSGDWSLLHEDGSTNIMNPPSMPLTTLQKRWLKAISLDPRVRLFGDDIVKEIDFPDVEPLFKPEDVILFDKYLDGDDYSSEKYIEIFKTILYAIKYNMSLRIDAYNRSGRVLSKNVIPDYLEYSEKDDKFRLMCKGKNTPIYNLSKIVECEFFDGEVKIIDRAPDSKAIGSSKYVVFELVDERKALERVLLHFAHFEKEVVRNEDNRYTVTLTYDSGDETEMVIRMLSFGPNVKVLEPEGFKNQIVTRLKKQLKYSNKNLRD